jgi:DbpA RNA binding domain
MAHYTNKETPLKNRLQKILAMENLETQRNFIKSISHELEIDSLTCAAALVYLTQQLETPAPAPKDKNLDGHLPTKNKSFIVKMVRYRLDVGSDHSITTEQLKKVLIEESGVDKNNINNINIQRSYTLIELPDEMPPDIFQHLKSVEINQHKLDIKRVKMRNNKKRGNNQLRRGRKRDVNMEPKSQDTPSGNIKKLIDK